MAQTGPVIAGRPMASPRHCPPPLPDGVRRASDCPPEGRRGAFPLAQSWTADMARYQPNGLAPAARRGPATAHRSGPMMFSLFSRKSQRGAGPARWVPRLEALEDRQMPSTLTVLTADGEPHFSTTADPPERVEFDAPPASHSGDGSGAVSGNVHCRETYIGLYYDETTTGSF